MLWWVPRVGGMVSSPCTRGSCPVHVCWTGLKTAGAAECRCSRCPEVWENVKSSALKPFSFPGTERGAPAGRTSAGVVSVATPLRCPCPHPGPVTVLSRGQGERGCRWNWATGQLTLGGRYRGSAVTARSVRGRQEGQAHRGEGGARSCWLWRLRGQEPAVGASGSWRRPGKGPCSP